MVVVKIKFNKFKKLFLMKFIIRLLAKGYKYCYFIEGFGLIKK